MGEAWIGVIGTAVGAVLGGGIAAYMMYRGQEREPRLLLLEKRIDAYSELFGKLYSIAECIHQNLPPQEGLKRIGEFRVSLISRLFYIDPGTKERLLAVYNELMQSLDKGQIDKDRFITILNDAMRALVDGIGIRYT